MASPERNIVFTNDLDGVHFKTPPPLKTPQQLIRRYLDLPDINSPIEEYKLPDGWKGIIISRWSLFCHGLSPVNKDSLKVLEIFRQVAEEHERQLKFAALSGREKYKHEMTRKRLSKSGHMEFFKDLYLNEGNSASSWKETIVRRLTNEGLNVVHIEDDLRPGLCVARVNDEYPDEDRILVYMMRNISNHPRLLKKSGIEIPNNLMFVKSFKEAAIDFSERIASGKI